MSMFYTDLIDVVRVSKDINGVLTRSINRNIPARVENNVKTIKNANGQDIKPDFHIMLDSSTLIDYNDKVIIKNKNGVAFPNAKEWAILSLRTGGGFSAHHFEVMV